MFHSKICPIIHYILYLDYVTFIFYIQSMKIFSHWFSHQCSFEVAQNTFLIFLPDQTIMEEASVLQTSAVEGSRTTLDESVMPPPSSQRGLKRKAQDTEPALPVSTCFSEFVTLRFLCLSDVSSDPSSLQMGALDQQQQQQGSRPSNAAQQLEASTVEVPPEETTTTNISQLIELDLLTDKDKKKNDDDSDEEVR